MQHKYGTRALADDEIAFPMSNVGAGVDVFWPVMNGAAVFDHIAGRSGPAWPAAFVTAGQIAPQLLALAGGAIDKSIDGLEAEDAETALVAGPEPAGDLFGRPSFGEAIADEGPELVIFFEDRFTPPAQLIGSGGVKRRIAAALQGVTPQLPRDGGFGARKRLGDGAKGTPRRRHHADLVSFFVRQMRIGWHRNTP